MCRAERMTATQGVVRSSGDPEVGSRINIRWQAGDALAVALGPAAMLSREFVVGVVRVCWTYGPFLLVAPRGRQKTGPHAEYPSRPYPLTVEELAIRQRAVYPEQSYAGGYRLVRMGGSLADSATLGVRVDDDGWLWWLVGLEMRWIRMMRSGDASECNAAWLVGKGCWQSVDRASCRVAVPRTDRLFSMPAATSLLLR